MLTALQVHVMYYVRMNAQHIGASLLLISLYCTSYLFAMNTYVLACMFYLPVGTTPEHMAKIAWKNHRHSVNNPYSQFRDEYTLDQIKASKTVHGPLTKLQCW